MSESVICKCHRDYTEEEFKKHFSRCDDFKKTFREFDCRFGELLKFYSDPKENLPIIRVLLKQYVGVVEKKIEKYIFKFS